MLMFLFSSCFRFSRITLACCNSFLRVAGVKTCLLGLNWSSTKMFCFILLTATNASVFEVKFRSYSWMLEEKFVTWE